jgi:hypothetical protein
MTDSRISPPLSDQGDQCVIAEVPNIFINSLFKLNWTPAGTIANTIVESFKFSFHFRDSVTPRHFFNNYFSGGPASRK